MEKEPECYKGEWPRLFREMLGYHEAGHAVIGMLYNSIVGWAWIADGRYQLKGVHVKVSLHGGTFSERRSSEDLGHLRTTPPVAGIAIGIAASAGAETLAPNAYKFPELARMYPCFFGCETDPLAGGKNDVSSAWELAKKHLMENGLSEDEAYALFRQDVVLQVVEDVRKHTAEITALAEVLIEKRFLTGEEAYRIVSKADQAHDIPGCHNGKPTVRVLAIANKMRREWDADPAKMIKKAYAFSQAPYEPIKPAPILL